MFISDVFWGASKKGLCWKVKSYLKQTVIVEYCSDKDGWPKWNKELYANTFTKYILVLQD